MYSDTRKWAAPRPILAVIIGSLFLIAAAAAHSLKEDAIFENDVGHGVRCIHDDIQRRVAQTGVHRIKNNYASNRHKFGSQLSLSDEWSPIRISFFADDVMDSSKYCTTAGEMRPDFTGRKRMCANDEVLTPAKQDTLLNQTLPKAIQLHTERLFVQPLSDAVITPKYRNDICSQFSVPWSHTTIGVSNTDFILYIATGTIEPDIAAWAVHCSLDHDTDRPIVGVINISPRYISDDSQTASIVAHEILHALGFTSHLFELRNMLKQTFTVADQPPRFVLTSPRVTAAAQKQYGCNTIEWMELENEGGAVSAASHWERRIAKDELMSPRINYGFYSAITLAAMEDLGFYKVNYSNAEVMSWGKNAGCDLLTQKCVQNGNPVAPSMFCTNPLSLACSSDRQSAGMCSIRIFPKIVPHQFNYFNHPHIIGSYDFVDFCPIVEEKKSLSCKIKQSTILTGSLYGSNSFCIDRVDTSLRYETRLLNAICAEVTCNSTTLTYQVKVEGMTSYMDCVPGEKQPLPVQNGVTNLGSIICPAYYEVCRSRAHQFSD